MNKNKGFTLIELLVVIAIIGILSSVVLASLNTARAKGADAAIKSNINNARAQAELYYDSQNPQTYEGVCDVGTSAGGILTMHDAAESAGGTALCYDEDTAWAMSSSLKSAADFYCVDSTGQSVLQAANLDANVTACTAPAPAPAE